MNTVVWEQTPKSDLIESIARAERLATLLSSPLGDDIRAIILNVSQSWLNRIMSGEAGAHLGLTALDDFVRACDLTITIGEGMKMELVKRQGGSSDGYIRAVAD
jgi:hypothetical protein